MTELAVYRVDADVARYSSLVLDLPEGEPLLSGDPAPDGSIAAVWRTPPVTVEGPDAERPDIWMLASLAMTPVVTPPVIERLEPFLSLAGELLPLQDNTGEAWDFLVLHVLRVLSVHECLDLSVGEELRERRLREGLELIGTPNAAEAARARAAGGDPWPYLAPAFVADSLEIPPTFFRIDRVRAGLFALDRLDEPESLLRRIEEFGVRGLVFQRVWSSEDGPEQLNLFR